MEAAWRNLGKLNLGKLKEALEIIAASLMVIAIVMPILAIAYKTYEQEGAIYVYYHQAVQAATPAQLAVVLDRLDGALDEAGMVNGNSVAFLPNEMPYKRNQLRAVAKNAEDLALSSSPLEVSMGMIDARMTLGKIDISAFSFWLLQQGGILFFTVFPVVLFTVGLATQYLNKKVPYRIRHWRVRSAARPV
ncbi:hypothetical protein ACFL11_00200 [Patescibacteria group bacterium]